MELLIKAAAIAAVGVVLTLVLKKNSPETAILMTLALCCLLLYLTLDVLGNITDFITELSDFAGVTSAAISVVLKTVGIAIVTKLVSSVCSDAGQSSVASALEIVGAAAALYVALPLMKSVFEMINSFI